MAPQQNMGKFAEDLSFSSQQRNDNFVMTFAEEWRSVNRAQYTWPTPVTTEFKSSAQRESSRGDSDGGVKAKESLRYSMCHFNLWNF